jgi:hypothetical protein
MKIIISPYSKTLRTGEPSPKNYPYWNNLISILNQNHHIIQIGVNSESIIDGVREAKFNLAFNELEELTLSVDTFISVDNFYPHFCNTIGKYGYVIWGPSNPAIYGYSKNVNILPSNPQLKANQFGLWDKSDYNINSFPTVDEVISILAAKCDK